MAPDKRYYIRAGAHTVSARHFIVEAIWAKRHLAKPRLTYNFRFKPETQQVIQLGIVALTAAPAVDVQISFSPLPNLLSQSAHLFPLKIPMIDIENPFFFDATTWADASKRFGANVSLIVEYKDLSGNTYSLNETLNVAGAVPPLMLGQHPFERIAKAIESIVTILTTKKK
jgi:hypothetical protein